MQHSASSMQQPQPHLSCNLNLNLTSASTSTFNLNLSFNLNLNLTSSSTSTFNLNLSNNPSVDNAVIGDATGVATIIDDDPVPTVEVRAQTNPANEGAGGTTTDLVYDIVLSARA